MSWLDHTRWCWERDGRREGGNTHSREDVMELTLYSKDSCPPCCILDADLPCKLLRVPTSIMYTLFYLLSVNCSGKLCGGGIWINLCTIGTPTLCCRYGTFIPHVHRNTWTFVIFCRVRSSSRSFPRSREKRLLLLSCQPSFRPPVRPSARPSFRRSACPSACIRAAATRSLSVKFDKGDF